MYVYSMATTNSQLISVLLSKCCSVALQSISLVACLDLLDSFGKVNGANKPHHLGPVSISLLVVMCPVVCLVAPSDPSLVEVVGWVSWVDDSRAGWKKILVGLPCVIFFPVDAVGSGYIQLAMFDES